MCKNSRKYCFPPCLCLSGRVNSWRKGIFSLHRVFPLILFCFSQTVCSVYHVLGDNHGSLWIISDHTLSWEGLIFSTQSRLSSTFTLSNLGSSCSINAIVFISVLMEMQEHSSDCDMPAVRQEAPGGKWKSVAWILSLQVLKTKAVKWILRREVFLGGKTQISGFYLFLHWSFPDLTTSKQSPEQTRPQWQNTSTVYWVDLSCKIENYLLHN